MSKINIVVAAQTGSAIKALDNVTKATQRTGNGVRDAQKKVNQFGGSLERARVSTRKFAMGGLQQAGYQIGDYAVQVANGTSKMQAFGQQAPQLLQIFGPLGAVVGAGVAIFSAFAVAVQKTRDAAKEVTMPIRSLSEALSVAEGQAKLTGDAFDQYLTETFGEAEAQIKSMVERLETIKMAGLSDSISKLLKDSSAPLSEMVENFDEISDAVGANLAEIMRFGENAPAGARQALREALEDARDFRDEFGLTTNEFQIFLDNMEKVKSAKTFEGLVTSIAAMESQLVKVTDGPIEAFRRSLTTLLEQEGVFDRLGEGGQAVKEALEEAADETESAAKSGNAFADAMQRASNAVMGINTTAFSKLQQLQAELRGRTRGLSDNEIRVMEAARKAEIAAKDAGVDSALELASIASEAARIEREIIAAESGLLKFTQTASSSTAGVKELGRAVKSDLSPEMKRLKDIQDSVGQSFENAMMSAVDGTNSIKGAFRSMASEIIKELYRIFVVKKITGFISDAISLSFGSMSPVPSSSRIPSADGGGYTGSGARAGGMDGKGGFMAMVHPRETIIDHTKGQGTGGVVVNQTINVSTGVQQTVRTEIKSLMPQIAESAKAAVSDAKRRGGSYGRSFA